MKYLKQLAIIIAVSFAGEGLRFILPFPIPAGIYGLVIMFVLLYSRVLKPESVETVSDFLIEIMAVMFVPGAVGIIAAWGRLQSMLLPKSITTAIGVGVADELGGMSTIIVPVIVLTGIFGNMTCTAVTRLFGITHPVAKGVAIGTANHAIGTSKAMEMGQVEGAMSGLSIAVAGLMTVAAAQLFILFR